MLARSTPEFKCNSVGPGTGKYEYMTCSGCQLPECSVWEVDVRGGKANPKIQNAVHENPPEKYLPGDPIVFLGDFCRTCCASWSRGKFFLDIMVW